MAYKVKPEDAAILEAHEQMVVKHRRTHQVIADTYDLKQPTKFRRKLPGKRYWKNKEKRYAELKGKMTADQFNAKVKADETLKRIFKARAKAMKAHPVHD